MNRKAVKRIPSRVNRLRGESVIPTISSVTPQINASQVNASNVASNIATNLGNNAETVANKTSKSVSAINTYFSNLPKISTPTNASQHSIGSIVNLVGNSQKNNQQETSSNNTETTSSVSDEYITTNNPVSSGNYAQVITAFPDGTIRTSADPNSSIVKTWEVDDNKIIYRDLDGNITSTVDLNNSSKRFGTSYESQIKSYLPDDYDGDYNPRTFNNWDDYDINGGYGVSTTGDSVEYNGVTYKGHEMSGKTIESTQYNSGSNQIITRYTDGTVYIDTNESSGNDTTEVETPTGSGVSYIQVITAFPDGTIRTSADPNSSIVETWTVEDGKIVYRDTSGNVTSTTDLNDTSKKFNTNIESQIKSYLPDNFNSGNYLPQNNYVSEDDVSKGYTSDRFIASLEDGYTPADFGYSNYEVLGNGMSGNTYVIYSDNVEKDVSKMNKQSGVNYAEYNYITTIDDPKPVQNIGESSIKLSWYAKANPDGSVTYNDERGTVYGSEEEQQNIKDMYNNVSKNTTYPTSNAVLIDSSINSGDSYWDNLIGFSASPVSTVSSKLSNSKLPTINRSNSISTTDYSDSFSLGFDNAVFGNAFSGAISSDDNSNEIDSVSYYGKKSTESMSGRRTSPKRRPVNKSIRKNVQRNDFGFSFDRMMFGEETPVRKQPRKSQSHVRQHQEMFDVGSIVFGNAPVSRPVKRVNRKPQQRQSNCTVQRQEYNIPRQEYNTPRQDYGFGLDSMIFGNAPSSNPMRKSVKKQTVKKQPMKRQIRQTDDYMDGFWKLI